MPTILRQSNETQNPTLPGGVYGPYITAGIPVYYLFSGGRTRFIIMISDGGKYGLADLDLAEYKGVPLTDFRFHHGTFTKQISPVAIANINATSDVVTTAAAHLFLDDDLVRFGSTNGALPPEISTELKYKISDKTSTTFKIKDADGTDYINFSTAGTGNLIVWKANAGWDDPDQGRPEFCPEFNSTFNNIAYVEGVLSEAHSHATNQPDWSDFRFAGTGRRLMDYDDEGNELGVIMGVNDAQKKQLSLVPLHVLDNYLFSYKGKFSRIDFASWREMRERAEVEIWQRIRTDQTGETHGLTGRYYQNDDFTNLIITRTDLQINFPLTGGLVPPAPGVTGGGFSVIWTGRIKFEFSETYTLSFTIDDEVEVFIDGISILANGTVGTHSVQKAFVADQIYNIEVRFKQYSHIVGTNDYQCQFKWQSPSQTQEIVPSEFLYPSDEIVLRYGQIGIAFPTPVEASEVHERLMERIPGYDWTDDNGKIVFLPPDREIAYEFRFDRIDDDSSPNFVYGTFQKRRRPLSDRRNFRLGRGRNSLQTGFPIFYVQADRNALRELGNGEPSNDAASELGVCTLSMAERMLEMEMVLKSDPTHTFNISGIRASSKIRKSQFILVFYFDLDGNYVANAKGIVSSHTWGASNSQNDFVALPIPDEFYTDEEAN